MTAANHALTGALIVATIPNPLLGMGVALVSHFALDSLPHFDEAGLSKKFSRRKYQLVLLSDGVLATAATLGVVVLMGISPWLAVTGAVLAMAPDLMWLPHYLNDSLHEHDKYGPMARIHKRMQGQETPAGLIIELIWFAAVLGLAFQLR